MVKKYGLRCFGCGDLFRSKEDVHRCDGYPYCEECAGEILSNQASAEYFQFQEDEWHRNNPGVDWEEEQLKQYYINRYGEY